MAAARLLKSERLDEVFRVFFQARIGGRSSSATLSKLGIALCDAGPPRTISAQPWTSSAHPSTYSRPRHRSAAACSRSS
eukprot:scaffold48495_cov66-Phaeocystis_antarctica.AAC.4